MTVLVTGGCGFIGGAIVRRLVGQGERVVNLDKLSYAATPEAVSSLPGDRHRMIVGDICDADLVTNLFEEFRPDRVIHCAAETHVDRSIDGPGAFLQSNVMGTFTLLEAARKFWSGRPGRFLHVSTDEVFGSLGPLDRGFTEDSNYRPNSPYSASKAAADHLVRAWGETYGMDVLTTNCSNNYGPWQYPEKLIPLMILNALEGVKLPVYGDGLNVRDWIHVEDHARALDMVLRQGVVGEQYNVGSRCERKNIDVVTTICERLDELAPKPYPHVELVDYVTDRLGHDRRYAIDPTKIETELGWRPEHEFESGLSDTVDWYFANPDWWAPVRMSLSLPRSK